MGTIEGTGHLLRCADQAGVRRFIYISSISVYQFSTWPADRLITEETPYETQMLTNYSRSKIEAEKTVRSFVPQARMTVVTLRPGILYGERGPWVLPRLGYRCGANRFVIVGSGKTILPVVYVGNLVDAVLRAVQADEETISSQVLNVVDDQAFTQREWFRRYKAEVNPRLRVWRCPYWLALLVGGMSRLAGRVLRRPSPILKSHLLQCRRQYRYSNEKIKGLLGWEPRVQVDEALERTMSSFRRPRLLSRQANRALLGTDTTKKAPLRVGVVGCGRIAATHLSILSRMANAKVVAVCDLNAEAAAEAARKYGVPHYCSSPEALFEVGGVDVVHVLTPPESHKPVTELAAKQGCHVYVEKPMAVDAPEAEAMVRAAEQAGVLLCVGHNHVFDPVVIEARRQIESGGLGDLVCAESYYGFDLSSNRTAVYVTAAGRHHWTFGLPGGLYHNLLPHPLSVLLDIVGEPGEMVAMTRDMKVVPYQQSDELRVLMQAEKALGLLSLSLAASPRFQYLRVFGTKESLFVDVLNKVLICQHTGGPLPKAIGRGLNNFKQAWRMLAGTLRGTAQVLLGKWTPYEGTEILIREFYSAVHEGRPSPIPGQAGLQVMKAMDGIWAQLDLRGAVSSGPGRA
ncbi:MAG: hypothetical protein AMJ77_05810 [Dehalococcoidia bacterium SM23_28_2]|nr:MAG: hypothetical protein AMJ77_05810 [Dehalococcoidia bacterium SM23_28_2]